jgi:hypothetical protein
MTELVAQDADELELAGGVELERRLVDQHVAARPRLVGKERARQVLALVHRPHVEHHLRVRGGAARVLGGDVVEVDQGDRLPRARRSLHLPDDRVVAAPEALADAVADLLLLRGAPHRVLPVHRVDDQAPGRIGLDEGAE